MPRLQSLFPVAFVAFVVLACIAATHRTPLCQSRHCAPYVQFFLGIPAIACHPGDCDATCPCDEVLVESGTEYNIWTCSCGGTASNLTACKTLVIIGTPSSGSPYGHYHGCSSVSCPPNDDVETGEFCVNSRTWGFPIPATEYDSCVCYDS
jgi:hypothetical protein